MNDAIAEVVLPSYIWCQCSTIVHTAPPTGQVMWTIEHRNTESHPTYSKCPICSQRIVSEILPVFYFTGCVYLPECCFQIVPPDLGLSTMVSVLYSNSGIQNCLAKNTPRTQSWR